MIQKCGPLIVSCPAAWRVHHKLMQAMLASNAWRATRCKAMCKPLFTIYTPTLTGLVYE